MRAAVFSRYWSTGGGGEKYAGTIAEVLSERYDTELLGVEDIDLDWLSERLHLDLSRLRFARLPEELSAVTAAGADVDLFVNVSYLSADPAAHRNSIYVVMFPPAPVHLSLAQRAVTRLLDRRSSAGGAQMRWGTGFHARAPGRRAPAWTDGDGVLYLTGPPGVPIDVEIDLAHQRPTSELPVQVVVEADGEVVASRVLTAPSSRVAARIPARLRFTVVPARPGQEIEARIRSTSFVPAEVLGTADTRHLGVPVTSIRAGSAAAIRIGRVAPTLVATPPSMDWLDTYGAVVSISEFTREWVQRWWGIDTEVLHPPVTMQEPSAKEPIILNVGRFFASDRGHSKKQLELVRAFRSLCDEGVHGWTLHLVGGCAAPDRPYVDAVCREAEGYPVEVHVDASGAALRQLYSRASIYWHASGLGEDPRRNPGRLEHFGITTVEAMSAGAVPVVIGLAGQLETVRHGVDGYHFTELAGLVQQTRTLIDDDVLRSQMSAASAARARSFSSAAFAERLWGIVAGLDARPPEPTDAQEPDRS